MTYLEKAKELRPEMSEKDIMDQCPFHYGLETQPPIEKCKPLTYKDCMNCWNREMPEVKNE